LIELRFSWDDKKSEANEKKHGVSFLEAQTVFFDDRALLIADPEHSDDEDRFVIIGLSTGNRALVACHCYRETETVIRLISARKASRKEKLTYSTGNLS
jgi:uncharacterized DUF497 family protein